VSPSPLRRRILARWSPGAGASYPLPAFDERVFEAQPKIANVMDFHAERIGDDTISNGDCPLSSSRWLSGWLRLE